MTIFIAGATGVGKTTLALEILRKFPARIISTSDIREVLRTVVSESTNPELFCSTYKLDQVGAGNPLQGLFEKQAELILSGVAAILNRHQYRNIINIAEGVHILPNLLKVLNSKPLLILLLRQPSEEEHWSRLLHRTKTIDTKHISKYEGSFHTIREIGNIIERVWLTTDLQESEVNVINNFYEGIEIVEDRLASMGFSNR